MKSKLKPHLLAMSASLGLIGFVAFVAWCGGYNFDSRGDTVGFTVCGAGLGSLFLYIAVVVMSGTDLTLNEIKARITEPMPFDDKKRNEEINQRKP